MKREKLLKLIASLPWKTDANGYAIIKRSHLVVFLDQGRTLAAKEVIHHINEIKADDSPDNLVVMTRAEHNSHHKPLRDYRGVVYTPELREKRRQQMIGNKHALKTKATEGELVH